MKLYEIKPLLQDMGRNKVKQDKFSFRYANLQFQVIILIEREPFELLFGLVDYNFSFVLCLRKGFELDDMPDDVYFYLRSLMKLCASEVDSKSIHPDVYHERRWLLWYLILSQTITMQSVTKPCRPPPAAGPDNLRIPKVLGYGFGEKRAKAKPHYKTW